MMKVQGPQGERDVADADMKQEAMKLLQKGYRFYEVDTFDAPVISAPC